MASKVDGKIAPCFLSSSPIFALLLLHLCSLPLSCCLLACSLPSSEIPFLSLASRIPSSSLHPFPFSLSACLHHQLKVQSLLSPFVTSTPSNTLPRATKNMILGLDREKKKIWSDTEVGSDGEKKTMSAII